MTHVLIEEEMDISEVVAKILTGVHLLNLVNLHTEIKVF